MKERKKERKKDGVCGSGGITHYYNGQTSTNSGGIGFDSGSSSGGVGGDGVVGCLGLGLNDGDAGGDSGCGSSGNGGDD